VPSTTGADLPIADLNERRVVPGSHNRRGSIARYHSSSLTMSHLLVCWQKGDLR